MINSKWAKTQHILVHSHHHTGTKVAHVVWSLMDYPESSLHSDGAAAAEEHVQIAGVIITSVDSILEVSVLVEDDLEKQYKQTSKK